MKLPLAMVWLAVPVIAGWSTAMSADAAQGGDFALGANAEKQPCRAVERFDAPKDGAGVDIYCGRWEKPSGFVLMAPARMRESLLARLAQGCNGTQTPLASPDFTELRQVACNATAGSSSGPRRYGLFAQREGRVLVGTSYPSDWAAMIAAARVISGAAPRTAVASGDRTAPGLREIEAVYPQGAPGQGAAFNFELLRRRAFERNEIWRFAGAEQDFEALLRAHDAVNPEDGVGRAEILAEIGLNLSDSGRYGEAANTFDQAASLARSVGATLLVGKIDNYRALDLLNQRHYAAARDLALAANRTRGATTGGQGGVAISATDARAVDQATAPARRSVLLQLDQSTDEERSAILSAQGFFIAAVASRALGDPIAGQYLAEASGELLRVTSPPAWLSGDIAEEEAGVRLASGDYAGAAARAQAGLVQVRLVAPQTRSEAHLLLILGRAQAAMGQTEAALASGRGAMDIFAHQLEQPGLPADLASGQLALLLDQWSRTQAPQVAGEYFETLALTWDGAAARSASQLAARLALRGAGDTARTYQDTERAYRAAVAERQRLALDSSTPPEKISQADALVTDTAKRFAAAEDDLRSRAPGYLELLNPGVSTPDLQAALPEKEGYLRIVMAAQGGFGALVTRAGVHPYAIALTGRQVGDLADQIRRTTTFHGRRLPPYDIEDAAKLYAGLIGPIAGDIAGLERLQVDVSGALASVPFSALVESAPQGDAAQKVADEDYSGVDWFARRLAITNALGPASFVRFRKADAGQSQGARSLAAFGDFHPDPAMAAARIATAYDLSARCQQQVAHTLATLGPLPDTADEARQVARTFGGKVRLRLGGDFTDSDFLHSPEVAQANVILIATHGVLDVSSCFPEPSLLTSLGPTGDGLIEASRVLDRKLDARLVILSACDTAGGGQTDVTRSGLADGGDALSGLVRGFLYAGVSDVLATEWKVDSATSASEVTSFLSAAGKPGATLSESLSTAQRALYTSTETGHPFYWAAFILVGDGDAVLAPPSLIHAGP
jgi:CHAT domain-containing protein